MNPVEIARLYTEEKWSATRIAATIRRSKVTVLYHLRNQGVVTRGKSEARSMVSGWWEWWNDERTAQLRRMWADGRTASEIGRRLGCTKSAVLGKAHRIGLPQRNARSKTEKQIANAAQAAKAAATFEHRSLIKFPPHLQARWEDALAEVKAQRGTE